MAKKISQLDLLEIVTGNEFIPLAVNGNNYKISISFLKTLVNAFDVGLGNVDNVSDLDKPISTAVANALNSKVALQTVIDLLLEKADSIHQHSIGHIVGLVESLEALAPRNHSHSMDEISLLNSMLDEIRELIAAKANSTHQHGVNDILGLRDAVIAIANEPGIVIADVTVGNSEW
jgi:hypothetical protein